MAEFVAPRENNYAYDTALDVRAVGGIVNMHVEVTTREGTENYWMSDWRLGVVSPGYGGRPGARDVWLSRRELPIRIDRELWAALVYDLETIRTAELDELRCRIVQTLDEEFGFVVAGE